jgi:hypothetical protein
MLDQEKKWFGHGLLKQDDSTDFCFALDKACGYKVKFFFSTLILYEIFK